MGDVIKAFAAQCSSNLASENGTMAQLKHIQQILHENPSDNLFLLINNVGSHLPFHNYEAGYERFRPSSKEAFHHSPHKDSKQAQMAVNAYDNTIVMLDAYIQQISQELQGRPFFYVYVSDHGETLGDGGNWNRLFDNKYLFEPASQVPLFMIASPEFKNLHPHFARAIENLKKNSNMRTSHAHIFHTMLGVVGISSKYYKKELDLSHTSPTPYSGPIPKNRDSPN